MRTPFYLDVGPDERDATIYVAHLAQGRLGLPDRDYYLKDDAHFQTVRTAYRTHIVKLLTLAGESRRAKPMPTASSRWRRRSRACSGRGCRTAIPSRPTTGARSPTLPAFTADDAWPS